MTKSLKRSLLGAALIFGLCFQASTDVGCPAGDGWLPCAAERFVIWFVVIVPLMLLATPRQTAEKALTAAQVGGVALLFVVAQLVFFAAPTANCLAGDFPPALRVGLDGPFARELDCAFAPSILMIVSTAVVGLAVWFYRSD